MYRNVHGKKQQMQMSMGEETSIHVGGDTNYFSHYGNQYGRSSNI
jgi:hypothetical protein